jgi:hypothetical protein
MEVYRRGKNWYIDFYAYGKRVRQKVAPNKKLAEKILHKLKTTVVENKFLDVRKKTKIKFEKIIEQYLYYAKANKCSWDRDEKSLRCFSTHFGGKLL